MATDEQVLTRMLDKLPDNGAWFGRTKAPNVRAMMRLTAKEVKLMGDLIDYSRNAVNLLRARGDSADLWGRDLEIPRFDEEADVPYTLRMQKEILRERNTAPAIEAGVLDILGLPTDVYEPWRDVLRFGQHSKLGKNKLTGRYYTNAVIDVMVIGHHHSIKGTVERLRAAGVRVFYDFIRTSPVVNNLDWKISDETTIRDLASLSRRDTFKSAELYDGSNVLVSTVTDPEAPTFLTGGILGYDLM